MDNSLKNMHESLTTVFNRLKDHGPCIGARRRSRSTSGQRGHATASAQSAGYSQADTEVEEAHSSQHATSKRLGDALSTVYGT